MDIDQLYTVEDHEKGAKMELLDQLGKKTGLFFRVVGVDSKKWRGLSKKIQILNEDSDNRGETAKVLSEAIIGYEKIQSGGKDLEFSKKMTEKILLNAPYLMGQVTKFILDRANFIKG